MCGFAGFLDLSDRTPADELAARVEAMALAIQYRGPDDSGVWVDGEAGVALGHRRLSIVDLSPMGHQPMVSADGRYQLAYNGEVYNWPGLKKELEELGHTFRGHSDTEVMLAAFCRWGVEPSVSRFNGMFAFALWDRKERVLTLARDRIGKKPLYYGWMGNVFLFGSELKALRAHPAWNGVVDRNVLALYLRHNYVPGPYSIYRNVFKVPQGCLAILSPEKSPAQPAITPYWTAAQAARDGMSHPFEGGEPEITDELEKLLLDAVGSRMVADVPLGAFLSGGIDSSLVVALMQAQSPRPVKTFTIGFHEKEYNEAVHAKAVAAHLGTDHTELYVTPPEAMGVIPDLPHMFDEPFADSSQIPTFLVSRLA
ncbi:MAG: asparagine synthase (glutamine-hydrolyzing), partial [Deltaproteobacteria bacterium]|nr:asparagine synthase (glutamine-hydrolyzing) [Deltaproteobacteria bacterium]